MQFKPVNLKQLFDLFGGELFAFEGQAIDASPHLELHGFRPIDAAEAGRISFLSKSKFKNDLLSTRASVVLVKDKELTALGQWLQAEKPADRPILWGVEDPYLWFARIQQWWVDESMPKPAAGIHPSASVSQTAQVDPSAFVGPFAVIGAHAKIGAGCQIHSNVNIGDSVVIGDNTVIYPGASIYFDCQIGSRCIIHSGAVIGADGFGFANHKGEWVKIPQVGRVIVSDQVEIGANTTIDRGALDDTLIGHGVKLDNQIMIGHNCTIGDHTAMAGCVGMAGSTHVGKHCTIGGAAMFFGHLTVADRTHIVGASAVMSSIKEPGAYAGVFPLDEHRSWEKNAVTLRKLNELRRKVAQLEKNINEQSEPGSND